MINNYKLFFVFVAAVFCTSLGASQLKNLPSTKKARVEVKDRVWPEKYGEGDVCLWKDDKLAAFTITIDDNSKPDHEFWINLGNKYGWRWTWFIVTGGIVANKNRTFSGNWADWQKLVDLGHDIQSHTVRHRSKRQQTVLPLDDEYRLSQQHIHENLKNERCLTLAYPGGGHPNDPKIAAKYYIAARGTVGHLNKRARINYTNTCSLSTSKSFFESEKHWASFAGMLNPKNRKKFRAWCCIHYHLVKDKKFAIKVLDHVKKHEDDIWVGTFTEVAQYGQESDTAVLNIISVKPGEIKFKLTDQMADDLFDYPLTVKLRLEPSWETLKATQNGKNIQAKIIEHNNAKFALIQAIPDKGIVTVNKQ